MEIRDYLRAIRRWLWLPLIVPLVAAGSTGYLLHRQPSVYQANATVIVPAVSAKGFSTSAASQYVATFKDVLVSQPIIDKVSRRTGVPSKDLLAGLSANTVTASSNVLHITFLGRKGENIQGVVREATVDTLDAVAQPSLVQAQNAVVAGQAQLQQANAAIQTFTANSGVVLPQQEFKTKQQELSQLLLQLQQTVLANDVARQATLKTVIAQRQTELAALGAQVSQFTDLSDARQAALSVRDRGAQELTNAQALLAANHNPNTVSVQSLGRVSNLSNILKFSGIAFAVALILALGFILLLELMRGRRVPAAVRSAEADEEMPAVAHANGYRDSQDVPMGDREDVPAWTFAASRPQLVSLPANGNGHDGHNGNGSGAPDLSDATVTAQGERRRPNRADVADEPASLRR